MLHRYRGSGIQVGSWLVGHNLRAHRRPGEDQVQFGPSCL
jgi:hypothetical protein